MLRPRFWPVNRWGMLMATPAAEAAAAPLVGTTGGGPVGRVGLPAAEAAAAWLGCAVRGGPMVGVSCPTASAVWSQVVWCDVCEVVSRPVTSRALLSIVGLPTPSDFTPMTAFNSS